IAAGLYHSLALKSDGTVWAWGRNIEGELGNGTTTTTVPYGSNTPVAVSGLHGVVAIAGGAYHSLALKSDGTVWTWGYNFYGVLGNGTTTTTSPSGSTTPAAVSGLSGVVAIAGGQVHSLALKTATVAVTVNTAPPGLSFAVDSTTFSTVRQWIPGSSHTIATTSPQGGATTQYIFQNWSDSGAASHTVTAPSTAVTYTATFNTQYYLTTSAGSGGVSRRPRPGS